MTDQDFNGRQKLSDQKKRVLAYHKKIGKRFVPPFLSKLGPLQEIGWLNYTLPELIWLAILNERCGLEKGADLAISLAKVAKKAYAGEMKKWFATASIYNLLSSEQKRDVLNALDQSGKLEEVKDALSFFIFLYPKYPLNFLFEGSLPATDNSDATLKQFKELLSKLYDKTTVEATFMQANAIYIAFVTDKLKVFKGLTLANFPEIEKYPHTEESQRVAGSIRSTVISLIGTDSDKTSEWLKYFWNRGLEIEPCNFQIIETYE